jgi:hypothetical protein
MILTFFKMIVKTIFGIFSHLIEYNPCESFHIHVFSVFVSFKATLS